MKLNLNELAIKVEKLTTEEVLNSITGGIENSCHVTTQQNPDGTIDIIIHK